MMATSKDKKRLSRVDVNLTTGTGETWDRKNDHLGKAAVTDTNVLLLLGEDDTVLMMYSPMVWASVRSYYEEVTE